MPRIARLVVKREPAVYHVMSITEFTIPVFRQAGLLDPGLRYVLPIQQVLGRLWFMVNYCFRPRVAPMIDKTVTMMVL